MCDSGQPSDSAQQDARGDRRARSEIGEVLRKMASNLREAGLLGLDTPSVVDACVLDAVADALDPPEIHEEERDDV